MYSHFDFLCLVFCGAVGAGAQEPAAKPGDKMINLAAETGDEGGESI
jgi:hypothetical protein